MKSERTLYRLASISADYRACHAIMRANGNFDQQLHFPTVVAERDGRILGFLSTNECDWCLLAGPLETVGRNAIMALRLIEAYEAALRVMGITRYCFSISRANNSWLEQLRTHHMEEIASDTQNVVFERILPGDPLSTASATMLMQEAA